MPRRRAVNLLKDLFKKLFLNAEKANGSGGSAVVIASRGGNSIMRKLVTMEKFFAKNKKGVENVLHRMSSVCG